ncbi:MAG: tRNA (adenosine(37)-N6)-threonylcarbamoyltransferase complex transferase subunit TsaD, partial [Rectinema sp.]
MRILGIETSCDECAAAVVEDGSRILSNVIMTQIPLHERYQGVVPEVASRAHIEWIMGAVKRALSEAGIGVASIDGIAATAKPGLIGSLAVGLSFAKALAWSRNLPFKGVNHMLAHLYAPQLASHIEYPFLGLLVSGGHTIICRADDFDKIT